jgi:hypothetical protein
MADMKTIETNSSVDAFIDSVVDGTKRQDCRSLTRLMAAATGAEPKMWGTSIVGFGKRHYQYANGKPGEVCKVGFAPRSKCFAIYLPEYPEVAVRANKQSQRTGIRGHARFVS